MESRWERRTTRTVRATRTSELKRRERLPRVAHRRRAIRVKRGVEETRECWEVGEPEGLPQRGAKSEQVTCDINCHATTNGVVR